MSDQDPPNDCTKSEYARLRQQVKKKCPGHGVVEFPYISAIKLAALWYNCKEMEALKDKWEACTKARRERDYRCFRGGDRDHQIARATAELQVSFGYYYLRKWGCEGYEPKWWENRPYV
jgi:Novel toxin 16